MNRNNKLILTLIISVSVIPRLLTAIYFGNDVIPLPGTADQVSYHALAVRVLEGYGFNFAESWWPATAAGAPTAHWSYLYTLYLVIVYAIFGPYPVYARMIQAILVGILHPYLAYLLGKRVFNHQVGLVSAGITAIYIYFIYYSGTLMTEPFYITTLMASFFLAMYLSSQSQQSLTHTSGTANSLLAIAFGICLGICVLLRQLFMLFIPFILIWILFTNRASPRSQTLKPILLTCLVICIMVLPFTIYNHLRFDQFVLLNTNAGYAFFWGNHPIHGTEFIPILPSGTYLQLIPPELLKLDEASLDKALLRIGVDYVLDDPIRYVLVSISRIPAYFKFWPSPESSFISNLSRVGSFGFFLPFTLYGLYKAFTLKRYKSIDKFISSPFFLLLLFITTYTGIHLLTWTLIRYRLPVDAVLLLFAGLALYDLYMRIQPRLRQYRSL